MKALRLREASRSTATVIVAAAILTLIGYLVAAASNGPSDDRFPPTVTTLPDAPMDPSQAQAIADGKVTDEEMASAYEAYAACIRASGYEARVVEFFPRLGATVEWESPHDDEAVDGVTLECRVRTVVEAEVLYDEQRGLSPEEQAAFPIDLAKCVTSKSGIEVDASNALTGGPEDITNACIMKIVTSD